MQLDLLPSDSSWQQDASEKDKTPFSVLLKNLIIIDVVRAKLARGDAALEQNIHLLERTAFGLCQTKPTPNDCDSVHTCPEESLCTYEISRSRLRGVQGNEESGRITHCLPFCIPRCWTHEVRLQDATNEIRKVIRTPSQHNRLRAQTRRPNLRHNGIHNRPNAHRVATQPHKTHDTLGQAKRLRLRRHARHDADQEQTHEERVAAPQPYCAAPGFGNVQPRDDDANKGDGGANEAEVVG